MHKLLNFADPTKNYVVSKLVMGSYRTRPCLDIRLPITLLLLDKLIDALYHTAPNFYAITLFKAMYLFAFNAFARIGEITANKNASNNVVQYNEMIVINFVVSVQLQSHFGSINTILPVYLIK